MADTEHKVKIDILGDASNLEKEMKNATKELKQFQKSADRIRDVDTRSAKQIDRTVKKQAKDQVGLKKQSLNLEKQLSRQIRKTTRDIRSKGASSDKEGKARLSNLKEQSKALAGLQQQRKKIEAAEKTGGRGVFGRGVRGALSGINKYGGTAVAGVAGAGLGYVTKGITDAVQVRDEYLLQRGQAFVGTGVGVRGSERARETGRRNLFTPQETVQQARQLFQAAGSIRELGALQRTSRTQGVEMGTLTEFAGTLARGGSFGERDRRGKKELERTIAAGMTSGLKKGRLTEYLSAVQGLVQQQQAVSPGEVGAEAINTILARLGSTGMPGLQGAAGAAVAKQLDESIRNPQGDAAQMAMLQAIGWGEDKSYVESLRIQQRGILHKDTGIDTLKKVMERIEMLGGGATEETSLLGSRMTGLTLDQFDAVRNALAQGGTDAELRERIKGIQRDQVTTDEQDPLTGKLAQTVEQQTKLVTVSADLDETVRQNAKAFRDLSKNVLEIAVPAVKKLGKTTAEAAEGLSSLLKGDVKLPENQAEAIWNAVGQTVIDYANWAIQDTAPPPPSVPSAPAQLNNFETEQKRKESADAAMAAEAERQRKPPTPTPSEVIVVNPDAIGAGVAGAVEGAKPPRSTPQLPSNPSGTTGPSR